MTNVTKVTARKKAEFLAALSANGANVTKAAATTGISRVEWYRTRREEPDFAKAWEEALEHGTDALEDEAVRRGTEGTLRPVFHQGVECGQVREYSDTLLIFMLKARRPEKFKDRVSNEHNVKALTLEQLVLSSFRPNTNEVRPHPALESTILAEQLPTAVVPTPAIEEAKATRDSGGLNGTALPVSANHGWSR